MIVRNQFITTHAVDAQWFLALKAIKRPLLLRTLGIGSATLAKEKEKVFGTPLYNPVFTYPHLQIEEVHSALHQLLKLQAAVYKEEKDSSIRTVYTEKLTELITEQELLLATATGNFATFEVKNQELYGELHSSYVTEHLKLLQSRYPLFAGISRNTLLPLSVPTASDFTFAQTLLIGPDIHVDTSVEYTSETIATAWNYQLEQTLPGWSAVVDSAVVQMMVDHKCRKVRIPVDIRMRAKKMRKLFVHEIGTHVYRREQGKQNRLQLASIGLAGYQPAEEGLAIMRAQLTGKRFYRYGGLDKYFVLALATGALDGVPKDFSETFRVLELYYSARLTRLGKGELIPRVAKTRAWNSTLRVFRGGNPSLAGCCFLRDKIYQEGNRAMWRLVQTHPEYFRAILTAKYNPEDELQRTAVEHYHIST